ncbi:c-type cytochrome [Roseovarius sp. MMSF_3281]|uniref:c-type cytochrome n=1 Tax=Roseovarius sp. MMSF_3281 TaxID=3046694 RepID=UPI00273D8F52|nr:c-type cytochrome [Roseovarius sp. MMSF_3281]
MRVLWASLIALLLAAFPAASQQFTTLKGHGGPVMGIGVNTSTGQVATASFDNSVGLWEGRTPVWLEGHEAAVNTVLFLNDTRLASAADDFSIILWGADGAVTTRLEGHKGKVMDLGVSPDGGTLASASWDGSIGIWSLENGARRFLQGHEAPVNAVSFGHDGRLFSASADGSIRIWDVETGTSRVLINQGFGVNRIVLAPDLSWLAYGAVDGMTRVIDPEEGHALYDFSLDRRPILSLAHHAQTGQLAVGDGHGYIMVIDTQDWRIARDFRAMQRGPVWALAFSADGQNILAAGLSDVVYSWPVALLDTFDPAGQAGRSFLRDPDEMPNGERQFMRKCSICHALTPPPSRKAGPSLYGVFGRKAGALPDYPYSPTLETADITWTDETIDALFDIGPDHYIPGSKMPMQRISAETDRDDLIEYLRKATAIKEN